MEYSAGLMSHMFWLAETRITAEKMCDGLSQDAIRELAVGENIYQMKIRQERAETFQLFIIV